MKATNECLFCGSRFCYERVVSIYDNGATYDEVACRNHIEELYKDSDEKAPKVMKSFITGHLQKRKAPFNSKLLVNGKSTTNQDPT